MNKNKQMDLNKVKELFPQFLHLVVLVVEWEHKEELKHLLLLKMVKELQLQKRLLLMQVIILFFYNFFKN